MNKEEIKAIVLSVLDKALFEHTKTYWLDDKEIESIKINTIKIIEESYVEI